MGSGTISKEENRDFINALKVKIAKDATIFMCNITAELKVNVKICQNGCV